MLRFFVNERADDWVKYLGEVEAIINNAPNVSTKRAPNEILYGFKLRDVFSMIKENMVPRDATTANTVNFDRDTARTDAVDAGKHASFHISRQYNKKHKDKEFGEGSLVFLRLGGGYKLRGIPKLKLGMQRVGPFRVLKKVGRLAYELELPPTWRIHPVISVAQLEPAPPVDAYSRTLPPPPPVDVEGEEEFEIELVLDCAMRGRPRRKFYLVRWTGYGPEYDSWIPETELTHAADVIGEFEKARKDRLEVVVR
jgi:hypothetical protein